MAREYERPFELAVVIEVEPKPGVEVRELGDHIVLDTEAGRQNYDPRETIAYLSELLRRVTDVDDELLWRVRHILVKEDVR